MGRKKTSVNSLCGQRIRELCKMLGLSEKEFAKKIGVCQQTISNIVTGNTGLSKKTLRKIINRYPRVSEEWLRGDPDAKMNFSARIYANEEEILKNRHALEVVLNLIGFKVSPPYGLYGFDDYFYDVISPDGVSVTIPHSQMNVAVETILNIISCCMQGIIKNGMPAEEFMDNISSYAVSRLDEICSDITDSVAKTDVETLIIEDLNHYAHVEMHKYDDSIYPLCGPGETEDDIKKRTFEESQKLDLNEGIIRTKNGDDLIE